MEEAPAAKIEIDMRLLKLKPEEAALLAGELEKPGWASRNEGIHERVSFEDTIWGFDLAGGSYYKTPLRVTYVKPGSRAEKAGIRPGDRLKRINDIDSSTLSIQEAHEIIVESGIHLRLAVTAPEDEEDAYFCYEDELQEQGYDSDEERRLEEERARRRQVHARVNHYWSLQWPWVSKRRIIYRESNCFMVPSKFEDKNRSKFPTQPQLKTQEDIVLDSINSELEKSKNKIASPVMNGNINNNDEKNTLPITNGFINKLHVNGNSNSALTSKYNGNQDLSEIEEQSTEEDLSSMKEDTTEEVSHSEEIVESREQISQSEEIEESKAELTQSEEIAESIEDVSHNDISMDESNVETHSEMEVSKHEGMTDLSEVSQGNENESIEQMHNGDESISKPDDDNGIESMVSESDGEITSTTDDR